MQPAKPALLFVDDEVRILRSMVALFRPDYDVFTAGSGVEALEALDHNDVNVIVCDQRMPYMSGVETLAQARKISPQTIRILLTGYTDLNTALVTANEADVFQYVHKPWDNHSFRKVIDQAVHVPTTEAQIAHPEIARNLPWSILILDEDHSVYTPIKARFAGQFDIHQAGSIPEALSFVMIHNIAVVVADNYVSGQSTLEFLTILRKDHPNIVTIVVSDSHDEPLVTQLINQTHTFRILPKPIRPSRLVHSVEEALEHRRSNNNLIPTPAPGLVDDVNAMNHKRLFRWWS
ncbi:MAG: response regulator [Chromatiales bacterium]|nr:response regulator [Chromatiales bacterium]